MEEHVTTKKVGLLVGAEKDFPAAFVREINRRNQDVHAELIQLGGTPIGTPPGYAVIIDRISHEIAYYRTYVKAALLHGAVVINNPIWSSAYDRFFNASLVTHLGFHYPRTVALPSHSYEEALDDDFLRNLSYPIPWEQHVAFLGGFPLVLRPMRDTMLRRVYVVHSYEELWHAYNQTGTEPMLLREHIAWDKYVRCICIGAEQVQLARYVPGAPVNIRYYNDPHYLTMRERSHIIEGAHLINKALGFEFNMVDFALQGDQLIAVEVTNPAPRLDLNHLTPFFFDWVVRTLADYVIQLAHSARHQQVRGFGWYHMMQAEARRRKG